MTTDTDKLVKMARAGGAESLHGAGKSVAMTPEQLAAFRDLIIASLCGDVEPVAFMFQHSETGRVTFVDAWQKENGWAAANPRYSEVGALHGASTVAALKARVAELEKDTARLEFVCNSPNRMVERENGLWRVYEDVAPTDRPTAVWQGITPRWHVTPREAIDAAITAALTKGQPAPQPQQEQP